MPIESPCVVAAQSTLATLFSPGITAFEAVLLVAFLPVVILRYNHTG